MNLNLMISLPNTLLAETRSISLMAMRQSVTVRRIDVTNDVATPSRAASVFKETYTRGHDFLDCRIRPDRGPNRKRVINHIRLYLESPQSGLADLSDLIQSNERR